MLNKYYSLCKHWSKNRVQIMSISIPDDRELKVSVKLSAIYMPEVGQANGYYSVFNFAPDPQNLRPINYDNKNNNPKIVFNSGGTQGTSSTEYQVSKVGSRVRYVPSLQNAHIVEPLTHPSASSCTFAFGGIIPATEHPIFNMLKGPTTAEFTAFPGYNPTRNSTVSNLILHMILVIWTILIHWFHLLENMDQQL